MPKPTSARVGQFTESVIREMTRLAQQHGAINLAQGFPDFPTPDVLKDAACRAIAEDYNQYAITWGASSLRAALAEKYRWFNHLDIDPARHITVCCGATECCIATLIAILNPGDEVVIFQPYYENYGPDSWISGATPRFVTLYPPDFTFDLDELRSAFSERTKAIVVNTPHNPTGHVFTREELTYIAQLCQEFDAYVITDEIYEHILYDGREHISIATLPDMWARTITISGMSKTYAVTGWRVAWCIAPEAITNAIRKVHDFLTVGAPHPLQEAGAVALRLPKSYYNQLQADYTARRALMMQVVTEAGFTAYQPQGSYYILTDIANLTPDDDVAFTRYLIEQVGVAVVPGSSFYVPGHPQGQRQVRFAFPKKRETLEAAAERLGRMMK